jgi:tRNA(Ser,Leu) C12 N-acetylase TAN1
MNVQDPVALLEAIKRRTKENPALYDAISRIAPTMETVNFHSPEEFRDKVKDQLLSWISQLAGRSFHVRFHRREPRINLRTPDVEKFLDDALLHRLSHDGTTGKISFTDPDFVLAVDSVDDRAGIGLWTRDDLNRHRLLRPD